ncbi:MAG: PAS domain S-box protein [Verrucomicrobia bacterium]|nr:PAS domain S-box protein [Verrucomicrobiota bacterium]
MTANQKNQVSEVLSESDRSFLVQFVSILDEPVIIADANEFVIAANCSAERIVGRSYKECEGTPIGTVLGLDESTLKKLRGAREKPASSWQEIFSAPGGEHARNVTIRFRVIDLPDTAQVYVLVLRSSMPWEHPDEDIWLGSPVIFFESDPEGSIRYGIAQFAEVLNMRPELLDGVTLQDLLAGGHRKEFQKIWDKVVSGHPSRGIEVSIRSGDGEAHPFWLTLFPVMGGGGKTSSVRGIGINVSIQKSLAYALEASEERFSVLFRESSDPILILAMNGDILSANRSFERMTGLNSADLFRGIEGWSDFVYEEDVSLVGECIKRCGAQQEGATFEFRMKNEDRQTWFEQSLSILHDEQGAARGIVAVARNIDERKQREARLREKAQEMQKRHQRAQALVAKLKNFFTRIGSLPTDVEGYMGGICKILAELYHPYLALVSLNNPDLKVYQAGSSVPLRVIESEAGLLSSAMCRQVLETGLPFYSNNLQGTEPFCEDEFVTSLGLQTYLGAPLRDSSGKIRGTLAIIDTDVRAFDSLDVEVVTVAALHTAARLRAEEQEKVQRDLEEHLRQAQKMEAVGMLAGGIAHDFNNILSSILGFSSYLLSKVEEGSVFHRDLGLIEQSAIRASELTRQLLAFARRKHFKKEPVVLNDTIAEVLSILRRSLNKNIIIEQELDAALPCVLGDAGQLNQVIMNIALNAADAMSEGGSLTFKSEARSLTRRERQVLIDAGDTDYVCVTISDTGHGMSSEVQGHIFDPFFTTKADGAGTGLGLSIVYGIVSNHGGDIIVDSKEERGTTFKLYLPVHETAAEGDSEEVTVGRLEGNETVMVVDDENFVRQMVTEVLKSYGYKVLSFESGKEAVEIYKAADGKIDLVLLDMVMPGMDGEAVFNALTEFDQDVKVLLTSGFTQEERSSRLIKKGAKDLIHKPYRSDDLVKRIRGILDAPVAAQAE